jgi:thioredoxin 1
MIVDALTRDDLRPDLDGVTVVDFFRDDCRFCDMLEPVLESVAFDLPFVTILKINCSDVDGLAEEFNIQMFPTVMLFKDGVQVESIVGFVPATVLVEQISKQLY